MHSETFLQNIKELFKYKASGSFVTNLKFMTNESTKEKLASLCDFITFSLDELVLYLTPRIDKS